MASELRVNSSTNRSGLGTITYTDSGPIVSGVGTFANGLTVDGTQTTVKSLKLTGDNYNANWFKTTNKLRFNDNAKATFGTADDLSIYHDGGNTRINNATGILNIQSDDFQITDASNTTTRFRVDADGPTYLRYNGSNKFETSNTGVTITGTAVAGGLDISGDIDVDGHTNLDNVSIAGVTTITGSGNALEIVGGLVRSRNTASARFVANNGSAEGYFGWSSGVLTVGQASATLSLEATGSNHIQLKTNGNERLRIDSNGYLSFAGDTDTYIWHPEANELAITVSGGSTPIIRFGTGGSNGTVGIKTDSALVTNGEALAVRGYSSFKSLNDGYAAIYTHNEEQGNSTIASHILFNVGGANRGGFGYDTDNSTLIMGNQTNISFKTGATQLGGTERLRITNTGNLEKRGGGSYFAYNSSGYYAKQDNYDSTGGKSYWYDGGSGNNNIVASVDGQTGNLMSKGNLRILTTGKGIDFSTTSDAGGMSSEILDDYEEGSWTPTAHGYTGSNTSGNCFYTKIGRLVVATFRITWPSLTNSTSAEIRGLPFQCISQTVYTFGGGFSETNDNDNLSMIVKSGSSNMLILRCTSSGVDTQSISEVSGKDFRGTVSYFTDS